MNVLSQLIDSAELSEAITVAGAAVKTSPRSVSTRLALVDLLIVAGAYERAETHARLAADAAPDLAVGLGVLRQHLRGMFTREAWASDGALPDFPGGPSECDGLAIKLNLAIRAGDAAECENALAALEAARDHRPAIWNGEPVEDLRDLNDALPHALEVISSGGNYLWVDFERISAIRFKQRESIRDLAFRRASLLLADGAEAEILVPAVYLGSEDASHRLAHKTEWNDGPGGTVLGTGQRGYLVNDEMKGIHDAEEIRFPAADG